MATEPLIDPANVYEMRIYAAACVLAKHLAYATAEAFLQVPTHETPITLWLTMSGAEKEAWIRRGMEFLRTLNPHPVTIVRLPPRADNVVAFLGPKES